MELDRLHFIASAKDRQPALWWFELLPEEPACHCAYCQRQVLACEIERKVEVDGQVATEKSFRTVVLVDFGKTNNFACVDCSEQVSPFNPGDALDLIFSSPGMLEDPNEP